MALLPVRLREIDKPLRRTDWFNLFLYHLNNRTWDDYSKFEYSPAPPAEEPHRILLIQLSSIGDVTYTIPALFSLKKRYPGAEIDFICEKECAVGIKNHPAINKIFTIPALRWLNNIVAQRHGDVKGELRKLIRSLTRREYEFAINLHSSPLSAIIMNMIAAPNQSGIVMGDDLSPVISGNPLNLYRFYSLKPGIAGLPVRAAALHCLESSLGYGENLEYYARSFPAEDRRVKKLFLRKHNSNRKHILINTGSRMKPRRWPAKHCARVVKLLLKNNFEVGLIGGPGDEKRLDEIKKIIGPDQALFSWYQETGSLAEDLVLSDHADLTITTDSGPLHLISMRGNSCLDLISDLWVGPWNDSSFVLRAETKRISDIEDSFILKMVMQMLGNRQNYPDQDGVNIMHLRPNENNLWHNFFRFPVDKPAENQLRGWLIKMFSLKLWLDRAKEAGWRGVELPVSKIRNIYDNQHDNIPPQLKKPLAKEEITGWEGIDFSFYAKPAGELLNNWIDDFYNA